ncbi:MAG: hypothetical protein QXF12_05300 [Candidatus Aenigmatarchaeota archaeon]
MEKKSLMILEKYYKEQVKFAKLKAELARYTLEEIECTVKLMEYKEKYPELFNFNNDVQKQDETEKVENVVGNSEGNLSIYKGEDSE